MLSAEAALKFYIDPDTGEPHLWGHGVREFEAIEILRSPSEDRPGKDGARVAMGRTGTGRWLRVIYVPEPPPDEAFVITAYELRGKPLRALRRRLRKRRLR